MPTIGNQIMETIMLHVEPDKKKAREICVEALRAVGISNPGRRARGASIPTSSPAACVSAP